MSVSGVTVSSLWTLQAHFNPCSLIEMCHKYDSAECLLYLGCSSPCPGAFKSVMVLIVKEFGFIFILSVCALSKMLPQRSLDVQLHCAESTIFVRQCRNPLLCGICTFPLCERRCGLSLGATSPFDAHRQRKYYSLKEIT